MSVWSARPSHSLSHKRLQHPFIQFPRPFELFSNTHQQTGKETVSFLKKKEKKAGSGVLFCTNLLGIPSIWPAFVHRAMAGTRLQTYKDGRIIISPLEKGGRTIDVVRRGEDLGQMVAGRKAAKKVSNVLTVCRRRGKGDFPKRKKVASDSRFITRCSLIHSLAVMIMIDFGYES